MSGICTQHPEGPDGVSAWTAGAGYFFLSSGFAIKICAAGYDCAYQIDGRFFKVSDRSAGTVLEAGASADCTGIRSRVCRALYAGYADASVCLCPDRNWGDSKEERLCGSYPAGIGY